MKAKRRYGILIVIFLWLGLSIYSWVKPATDISYSERRKLEQMPILNGQSWSNGSFTSQFERYTNDQFPLRDPLRGLKSRFQRQILLQKDYNGIYVEDGFAAQIQYPLDSSSVDHFNGRINRVFAKYLADSDCRIFLSIVPDKHYFLADMGGYPSLNYGDLTRQVMEDTGWATYIDLYGKLRLEDYYRADTHWRQEKLVPAADALCNALRIPPASSQRFAVTAIDADFYGVYRGQAALSLPAEKLYVLRSDVLNSCRVYNYENNSYTEIYDNSKLESRDLYDIYLSGATPLLRIENPAADNGRELIVFRDSFGSSMIPLLVHGYETVIVVDTRYVHPDILGDLIEFSQQDVLFLYSTILINNSSAMK